ncbi:MAG: DUF3794 domain-containing protein [Candidatus Fimivivens sp.]
MELNLHRRSVAACELVLDTAAEHPIECDVLLPDYCPDIVRVLCCQVQSAVTDCAVRKTTFTVEGMAVVKLCYVGEVGGVRKTEYKIPFSKSFELKNEPMRPIWSVTCEQGHTNCRAASRRRIDVRGAIMLRVKLLDASQQQAVDAAEGMGVQLRSCEESVSDLTGQLQHQFSVAEILTPGVGKNPAIEIVRAECRPTVQESRVMASRVLLKGELMIHLLYKTDPESGALETADYSLPLSQVIEADNLDEEMQCEAQLKCVSLDCAPEETGQDGDLRLELQLVAAVRFFRPIMLTGATDSYSTLYPTQNTLSRLRVPKGCTTVSERGSVRTEAEAPEDVTALLDVWASPFGQNTHMENGMITVSGQLKFMALVSTEELGADCVTHTCEMSIKVPCKNEMAELMSDITVLTVSGSISQGKLMLGCEVLVSGMLVEFEVKSLLTDLVVDESNPRKRDPLLGLMIYYANAGEHIWDISKKFGSLPTQIMADNELTQEVLETDMPLMIPTV